MLAMNPRGRVPVLKDGDYVVFESLAVLYYLDRKYPAKPLFGDSPEEGAVIMRVCCEYQAYIEPHVMRIMRALLNRVGDPHSDESTVRHAHDRRRGAHHRGPPVEGSDGSSARNPGASDYMIYPGINLLLRALCAAGGARVVVALPARRSQLSGARPLDAARRIAAGLRAHLSAALARRRPEETGLTVALGGNAG